MNSVRLGGALLSPVSIVTGNARSAEKGKPGVRGLF